MKKWRSPGTTLARAFADHKVAALKADWTNQDSEITALLASHGRSGVPLYLYFGPGAEAPVVLPQLLTESTVSRRSIPPAQPSCAKVLAVAVKRWGHSPMAPIKTR